MTFLLRFLVLVLILNILRYLGGYLFEPYVIFPGLFDVDALLVFTLVAIGNGILYGKIMGNSAAPSAALTTKN